MVRLLFLQRSRTPGGGRKRQGQPGQMVLAMGPGTPSRNRRTRMVPRRRHFKRMEMAGLGVKRQLMRKHVRLHQVAGMVRAVLALASAGPVPMVQERTVASLRHR